MNPRGAGARRRSGFTLLEVVVAMTIVGLGVVTLLEIFSLGLRLGGGSSARTEAVVRGRQVLDGFLVKRSAQAGAEEGPWNENGRWRLEVRREQEQAFALALGGEWELQEITLDVPRSGAAGEKSLEFRTLRLVRKKAP